MGNTRTPLRRTATALNLLIEDVKDPQDEFLDILQPVGPSRVVLLIHNATLQHAQAMGDAPASFTSTPKRAEICYFISARNTDFLVMHPPPNSLVV